MSTKIPNNRSGSSHPNWKGGRNISSEGYIEVMVDSHPRRSQRGYVFEHMLVAEKALGHYLPEGAIIHHIDENRQNNQNVNLIICENNAYHRLIHRRMNAFKETGNANMRICNFCKKYDLPDNLYINKKPRGMSCHRSCKQRYERDQWAKGLRRPRNIGSRG